MNFMIHFSTEEIQDCAGTLSEAKNPSEAVVFDKNSGALLPIPHINTYDFFEEKGCQEKLMYIHSETMSEERRNRTDFTLKSIHKIITTEYRKLSKVVKS